jgi:DNA-binding response OmpR family regulator
MPDILLFVKNFRLGTKISEALTDQNMSVKFAEGERFGLSQINDDIKLVILDLDDSVFQTVAFVSGLRNINKNMKIAGYMKVIHKETYDRLKAAGCDIILPKSSFVKNLHTLIS